MRWTIVGREAESLPTIFKSIHSIPVNIGHISRYIRHTSHQIPDLPASLRLPTSAPAPVRCQRRRDGPALSPNNHYAVLTICPLSPGGNAPHSQSRPRYYALNLAHTRVGFQQLSLVQMAGSLFCLGLCSNPLSNSGLLRTCNA